MPGPALRRHCGRDRHDALNGENTPLNLTSPSTGTHASTGGASLVRTIVGLAIVIGVIWGLSWILRQVKSGKEPRSPASGWRVSRR